MCSPADTEAEQTGTADGVGNHKNPEASPFFAAVRRFTRGLIEPVQGYESSGEDARRFALGICVVLAIAGYLFAEESSRRNRLADVVFYDHILHAMDHVGHESLPDGLKTDISRFGIVVSPILKKVTEIYEIENDTISTVTGGVVRCEVELYRVAAHGGVVAGSDRDNSSWALAGEHEDYLLLSFPSLCNVFGQNQELFALVGSFSLATAGPKYTPDSAETAVVYDWHGDLPARPRAPDDAPMLFRRSVADARSQLLRIAQNVTGRYYVPTDYKNAIAVLSTSIQEAPTLMGISLPPAMTVLALPVVVCVLSFALYHRVRRLNNDKKVAWVMVTHRGLVETVMSGIWKAALLVTPVVVYVTSGLYVGAQPELRGDVQYIFDQSYSTERVRLLSRDLWFGGVRSPYIVSTCGLALALVVLSLIVLNRHTVDGNDGRGGSLRARALVLRLRLKLKGIKGVTRVGAGVVIGGVGVGVVVGVAMRSMEVQWGRLFATEVELGASTKCRLTGGSDVDYFRVRITEDGLLTVQTSGDVDTVGVLTRAGSDMEEEENENDDGGVDMNFLIEERVAAGSYYVQVRGYDEGSSGDYTLHTGFAEGGR